MTYRLRLGILVVFSVLTFVAAGVVLLSRTEEPPAPSTLNTPSTPSTPTTTAPAETPETNPDETALVNVAVATLWLEPDKARPVDEPSLANPVDIRRWVSTMTIADKRWLVDKLATQVLFGERVTVLATRGAWTKVAVTSQPSSLDGRGYPGWLPSVQLARDQASTTRPRVVVNKATAPLRDPGDTNRTLLELSYNTTLPVVALGGPWVTVALPRDGLGLLASSDVELIARNRQAPTGQDLVKSAQMFAGLPYLWAGNSAAGFDCSGFTSTVYAAHGIVIPRDADDQAAKGTPVDRARLEPGDLLFYAEDDGRGAIHHVAMYVGNGQMIQSPATGRTVETVPVETPSYAKEFWGARRYLAAPAAA